MSISRTKYPIGETKTVSELYPNIKTWLYSDIDNASNPRVKDNSDYRDLTH